MLTTLSLSNFKSWQQIDQMRIAPITGLFGTNSSGKTSILQLILMLQQTVESSDRLQVLNFGDENSLANLGSFREVVYGHQTPGSMKFSLTWTLDKELKVVDPSNERSTLFKGSEISFASDIAENGSGKLAVKEMAYSFAGERFAMKRKGDAGGKYDLQASNGGFEFVRARGRPWELPAPVKCYGFPDQVKAYFQNAGFLADLQLAFEKFFSRLYYLGPLREYPHRQYSWTGAEPADMGRRGEKAVDALLAAREKGLTIRRGKGKKAMSLEAYVAQWLQKLGLIHAFSVEPIAKDSNLYRVWVQKTASSAKVLITDVGFGVSQILPVLVLCFYVPEGSTILLEQPEIHLHPSVQAGLADVFIDAINTRRVQIIFESHSEHLLRRLQRRMAEEDVQPNATAMYFCDTAAGASVLTPLDLDVFGNITNWPKDFFGDDFGDVAAQAKAALERKKGMRA